MAWERDQFEIRVRPEFVAADTAMSGTMSPTRARIMTPVASQSR
jgi:hypothetical protein